MTAADATRPVSTDAAARPPIRRSDLPSRIGGLIMLVGVLVMALWVPFNVGLGTLTDLVGLFALIILGTTWNLMAGYGGMVSVGQQAFLGAGGYAAVYFGNQFGLPVPVLLIVTAVVGAVLALPTSFLTFRLVGGYFAIGTWVVAEVFKLLTTQLDALGGGAGLSVTFFRNSDRVDRIAAVYWTGLAAVVVVVATTYLLMRSPLGLALTAVRDNAVAASSVGVEVRRVQRVVYVVASGGAAVAGALLAINALRVTPTSMYSVTFTAYMIFIVVIGGLGTIEGPVLGAIIFFALQQQLSAFGTWYLVVLGAVAVIAVLALPQGLWGLISGRGRIQLFPVGYQVLGPAPTPGVPEPPPGVSPPTIGKPPRTHKRRSR